MAEPGSMMDQELPPQDWPNRHASFLHHAGGLSWHVQQMGDPETPAVILVHGTGASSHSFRDLMPALAEECFVTAFDLPGHGFTRSNAPLDLSLPGITRAVATLFKSLGIVPAFLLGHSAGAAIALQYALDHPGTLRRVFGINSALAPIKGNALLSPMAKLLFANPVSSVLFSLTATQSPLGARLLQSAGPQLDAAGRDAYTALMGNPSHVRGALGMMASWDLAPLATRLTGFATPCTLIVASDDKLVPPSDSRNAVRLMSDGELVEIGTGGHLLHEIRSSEIARLVRERIAQGVSPGRKQGGTSRNSKRERISG